MENNEAKGFEMPLKHQDIADAASAAERYGLAVLQNNETQKQEMKDSYKRLVAKLSRQIGKDSVAGGHGIAEALSAKPGVIPHWGQTGRFIVKTDWGRVLVYFAPGNVVFQAQFGFYVIDIEQPFISDSGYASCVVPNHCTGTVEEMAIACLKSRMSQPRYRVAQGVRSDCWRRLPEWVQALAQAPEIDPCFASRPAIQIALPF